MGKHVHQADVQRRNRRTDLAKQDLLEIFGCCSVELHADVPRWDLLHVKQLHSVLGQRVFAVYRRAGRPAPGAQLHADIRRPIQLVSAGPSVLVGPGQAVRAAFGRWRRWLVCVSKRHCRD